MPYRRRLVGRTIEAQTPLPPVERVERRPAEPCPRRQDLDVELGIPRRRLVLTGPLHASSYSHWYSRVFSPFGSDAHANTMGHRSVNGAPSILRSSATLWSPQKEETDSPLSITSTERQTTTSRERKGEKSRKGKTRQAKTTASAAPKVNA